MSLHYCVMAHAAVAACAMTYGWCTAVDEPLLRDSAPAIHSLVYLLVSNNLRAVFALMLVSICTVGVLGAGMVAANAYMFGLFVKFNSWAWSYMPVELLGVCIAVGGATHGSIVFMRWLQFPESSIATSFWRRSVSMVGLTVALLVLAAVLEAVAITAYLKEEG